MVMGKNNFLLKFSKFDFEDGQQEEHINKMKFSGVCLPIGKPSVGIPVGAEKPVIFSPEAITKCLDTFNGMGVDCVYDVWSYPNEAMTGHDHRFKIGVVEGASVEGDYVNIAGHLWQVDFPDVCEMIKNAKDSLGFSVEVTVKEMEEDKEYWYIKDCIFTGVAILYKNLAAFGETQLAASRRKEMESEKNMDEKTINAIVEALKGALDFKGAIAEALAPIDERLKALEGKEVDFSAVNEKLTKIEEKVAGKADEPKPIEANSQPERKTSPAPVGKGNEMDASAELAAEIEKIDNDKFLSASAKLEKKMEVWRKSIKAKAE